ncbi:GNAT family N-acetyltransferase [Paenibacillus sp. NPDC058071]|uniref:GNAT family N-acetyltransferase n=1 Tax=Paenibacillus sp. NPDC058071 TaxID=3346326 RepID=UPI0036DD93FB
MYKDEQVTIRPIAESDLSKLWALIYEEPTPEWKRWDAPYYELTPVTLEQFLEDKAYLVDTERRWVIEADGELIGTVNYYWEHQPSLWMEIGIVIYDPSFWNGGVGTKAMRLWINHLFRQYSLVRIGFITWSENNSMIRLGEKLGMTIEARIRKCRLHKEKWYDSIRMGILREEWDALSL